ncbi:MAG: hypothetical protein JOY80_07455, partial [Candidatus Dormibacteraeota bacterium]|nr:hypothetical protein [Candidatus Dormibacteraeota bacterium]
STVSGSLSVTGSVSTQDVIAMANSLLGTNVDASSLGNPVTITGVTFSFTTATPATFTLDATATIRTLNADVALSLQKPTTGSPKLIVGLHLVNPSCTCIKLSDILGGTLSALAGNLQFPEIDVAGAIGFGNSSAAASVDPSTLPSNIQAFLKRVYGATLPTAISLQPKLTFAGNVTLPAAVTSAFGMSPNSSLLLQGDVGVSLGSFGSSSGAAVLSGSLTATLPNTLAATLPSWLGSASGITWTTEVTADTGGTVQLELQASGTIPVTIDGTAYDVTFSGDVATGTGSNTGVQLTGTINGTISNLFGISWLSATNPSVTLSYDTSKATTSFSGEFDTTLGIGSATATVVAKISDGNSTGNDASIEVTLAGPVNLTDVATALGGVDLSGLTNLPALSLNSLDASFATGSKGQSFDLSATTSFTPSAGGSSINSVLLLSVQHTNTTTNLLAGLSATSSVTLSQILGSGSSLPGGADFQFPNFAAVLTNSDQSLSFSSMTPDQQAFFNAFCADSSSACHSTLTLKSGLTVVAESTIPSSLTGIMGDIGLSTTGPVLVTGHLPVFGSGGYSLMVDLPDMQATSSTPDFFESGQVSFDIESSPTPSLTLTGAMTFNIPTGSTVSDQTTCQSAPYGGVWRAPRQGGSDACYDQVPFAVSVAVQTSPPTLTFTGGLEQGHAWTAPFGQSWIDINQLTLQLGISTVPAPVTFTIGFNVSFTVDNHDFTGAFLLGVTPEPAPPFVIINPEGFRVASSSGLALSDLLAVGTQITGVNISLSNTGVPDVALRKLDFSYSEVNDPALCLQQGIHAAGQLYIGQTATDSHTIDLSKCPTDSTQETSRTTDCENTAGCFAAADFSLDDHGLRASGVIGPFKVGPVNFGGAQLDLVVSPTVQRLLLKGSMDIDSVFDGSIDLLVSTTDLHFRGAVSVFNSAFDGFIDGDAGFTDGSLTSLKSLEDGGSFSLSVVLKSDFLNLQGVALSGTMQQLRPLIQALDVVLVDIAEGNDLGAITDTAQQAINLGVSLPAPYGTYFSDISSELGKINNAISAFGHAVSWGVNDLLNGFTLSFPGIPGVVVPATCVTTEQDGTCYSIPPGCVSFGLLGSVCSPGTPGYVTPATCVTTEVNGTCYSVPPVTGVTIPGLCGDFPALQSLLEDSPGGSCDINNLVPNLINPALKAIFKAVTGDDPGNVSISTILSNIEHALGSGDVFAINCAEFNASATTSGSPSASVSLATDLDIFGNDLNFGIGWNFSPDVSNVPSAVVDIIQSLISPTTNVTCGLPADWNTNMDYPDAVGTGPGPNNGNGGPPPTNPVMTLGVTNTHATINEGGTATVSGTITPAPPLGTDVSVNWGDGSSAVTVTTDTSGAFSAQRTFLNNTPIGRSSGEYVITATQSGGSPHATTTLIVDNVAPSNLHMSGGPVSEGSPVTLTGSFTDPGYDTHSVRIAWGDGSVDTLNLPAGQNSFSPQHTYVDNNGTSPYSVGVTVTDDDLASVSGSTNIQVNNVAPNTVSVTPISCVVPTGAPVPCTSLSDAQENAVVTFRVTFKDPGVQDTETPVINWGDGNTTTLHSGLYWTGTTPTASRTLTVAHQFTEADVNPHPGMSPSHGVFTVGATITDKDGGVGSGSALETVENVVPFGLTEAATTTPIVLGANHLPVVDAFQTGIHEGDSPVAVYGSFVDNSGGDTHTVTIDWGPGWSNAPGCSPTSSCELQTLSLGAGVFSYSAQRAFGDEGTYPIKVTVTDDDGASTSTMHTLTVYNSPNTATINRSTTLSAHGGATFFGGAGSTLTFSEHTTDPGHDNETVTWNWGDGSTTATAYPSTPPPSPVWEPPVNITDQHAHAWPNACIYPISATAADDDSPPATATDTSTVIVNGSDAQVYNADFWKNQFYQQGDPKHLLSTSTLSCYLGIVRYMSSDFSHVNTFTDALAVLDPKGPAPLYNDFDRELLAAWLDFANGGFQWNMLTDTADGPNPYTMAFSAAMTSIEQARLSPTLTQQQEQTLKQELDEVMQNGANATACNGVYFNRTVTGDLYVAPGVTCTLVDGSVAGNSNVQGTLISQGASFAHDVQAQNGSLWLGADASGHKTVVNGNVHSNGSGYTVLIGASVMNDVQIQGNNALAAGATVDAICSSTIGGQLQLQQNSVPFAIGDPAGCGSGGGNTVAHDVQVQQNTVPVLLAHSVLVTYNQIGGNLSCQQDVPAAGGVALSNHAHNATGECSGLKAP